jgi:hypothetical protein
MADTSNPSYKILRAHEYVNKKPGAGTRRSAIHLAITGDEFPDDGHHRLDVHPVPDVR